MLGRFPDQCRSESVDIEIENYEVFGAVTVEAVGDLEQGGLVSTAVHEAGLVKALRLIGAPGMSLEF
jgi:hypothetical protein